MASLKAQRIWFGNTPVDAVEITTAGTWLMAEMTAARSSLIRRAPIQVMGPNAYLVTLARQNATFSQALRGASICLPDGISVVWGARLLGQKIEHRVTGGDFMEHMCALCAQQGFSVYFLGGLPGAAEGAANALAERYPGLRVAGTDCPPLGFEKDEAQNEAVRRRIAAARPDLLCVAFGAPKQEIWMLDECGTLPIGAALSVGAAFDTQAGLRKRAPAWTHAIGMEWLYRLIMEPRRLWRRYLLGNTRFLAILLATWIGRRKETALHAALHQPAKVKPRTPLSNEDHVLLHMNLSGPAKQKAQYENELPPPGI